jgi:hypothetical protein
MKIRAKSEDEAAMVWAPKASLSTTIFISHLVKRSHCVPSRQSCTFLISLKPRCGRRQRKQGITWTKGTDKWFVIPYVPSGLILRNECGHYGNEMVLLLGLLSLASVSSRELCRTLLAMLRAGLLFVEIIMADEECWCALKFHFLLFFQFYTLLKGHNH